MQANQVAQTIPKPQSTVDRWIKWFFRTVAILGIGLIVLDQAVPRLAKFYIRGTMLDQALLHEEWIKSLYSPEASEQYYRGYIDCTPHKFLGIYDYRSCLTVSNRALIDGKEYANVGIQFTEPRPFASVPPFPNELQRFLREGERIKTDGQQLYRSYFEDQTDIGKNYSWVEHPEFESILKIENLTLEAI